MLCILVESKTGSDECAREPQNTSKCHTESDSGYYWDRISLHSTMEVTAGGEAHIHKYILVHSIVYKQDVGTSASSTCIEC